MSRRRYARGRHAWGECARSGDKVLRRNMVYDGHQPGLLVRRDWYEPVHPQEKLPPVSDPVGLRRPAPDRDEVDHVQRFPTVNDRFERNPDLQAATAVGYLSPGIGSFEVSPTVTSQEVGTTVASVIIDKLVFADGSQTATEQGTAPANSRNVAVDQETSTALGAEATSGTVGEDGNEAATELGTVNTIVVEAGWGSGAFGEGTYSN